MKARGGRGIRVHVASPHPIVLEALRRVLEESEEFELVSVSSSVAEATSRLAVHADCLLLDSELALDPAIAVLARLKPKSVPPQIVVFGEWGAGNRRSGIEPHGVVPKTIDPAELPDRLREVIDEAAEHPFEGAAWERLTPREREVVLLAARGSSNKEIGTLLGLAPGTVKIHLHAAYRKLGVRRRIHLQRIAGVPLRGREGSGESAAS